MLLLKLSLVLAVAAATASAAEDIEHENGVLVLGEDNFDKAIEANEHILVEFYAPWCGHCKSLAPEYEKAAEKLSKAESKIKLAKVDATVHKKLGEKYEVKGFPTLKFIVKGETKDYNGPRNAEGIVAWLKKKTGPPAQTLTKKEESEKLTEEEKVVVIGFFKDQESADAKAFLQAASDNDEIPFAITDAKSVRDLYKMSKKDGVVLVKQFDDKREDYDGKMEAADINKWAVASAIPLINEFSQETAQQIFGSDIKVHFILLISKADKNFDKSLDAMRPVAKANKGKIIFVYLDIDTESNAQVLEFFGIAKDDCPKYLVYSMEKNAKYVSEKAGVVEKEVSQFVSDFFEDKLTRTLKSEDLPKDWDEKPVKVLVSSNFKEVAMDKTKDVFVEFYAPWCGHCKALTPKWEELAEKFKDDDSVVIAKMDATANEVEEVEIQGFPTLKLYKKESNEEVDYSGPREVDAMVKFVQTYEIEKPAKPEDVEDYDEEEEEEDEEEVEEEKKDKDEL